MSDMYENRCCIDTLPGFLVLCALEDYIPVMTDYEIARILTGRMKVGRHSVARWEVLTEQRRKKISDIFTRAYAKQR
ncbi:MAG: hypothetical protein KBS89_07480 [Bacteroidales bacterium]|nr:hypothetical protein [Candidatus Egerieousia equi]